MIISAPISACGEYKIIRHTGHIRDAQGSIVRLGRTVEETPWFDNEITNYGGAFYVNSGTNLLQAAVLRGPKASVTLGELVSASTTRRNDPDQHGNVTWQTTWRFTSTSVGTGIVRLSAASIFASSSVPIWVPLGSSAIPVYSGRVSTADLESSFEMNLANENIDVVWRFTEVVRAEVRGSARVTKIAQVGVLDSNFYVGYTLRPANFGNDADAAKGWKSITGSEFPSAAPTASLCRVGMGTIGATPETEPTFTEVVSAESAGGQMVYLGAPKSRWRAYVPARFSVGPTLPSGYFNVVQFMAGHTEWQLQLDEPVLKDSWQLDVGLMLSISNSQ